jgi:hypothetical protein
MYNSISISANVVFSFRNKLPDPISLLFDLSLKAQRWRQLQKSAKLS